MIFKTVVAKTLPLNGLNSDLLPLSGGFPRRAIATYFRSLKGIFALLGMTTNTKTKSITVDSVPISYFFVLIYKLSLYIIDKKC